MLTISKREMSLLEAAYRRRLAHQVADRLQASHPDIAMRLGRAQLVRLAQNYVDVAHLAAFDEDDYVYRFADLTFNADHVVPAPGKTEVLARILSGEHSANSRLSFAERAMENWR